MSSLPSEVLQDVLQPMDRWTLDGVQFTDRRFLQLITNRMSDVCLRRVNFAVFQAPDETNDTDGTSSITMDGRPERWNADKNTARLFADFVQALRSSSVAFLALNELVFTPEFAALVLQTRIITDTLSFYAGICGELTTAQFHDLLLHFSPTSLDLSTCHLRACQITDELLRALSKNRVWEAKFPNMAPVDGGNFCVTDDAVVDFCVQPDVQTGQEGDEAPKQIPYEELKLYNGSFTKDLFKRLVEASSVSTRTQPL